MVTKSVGSAPAANIEANNHNVMYKPKQFVECLVKKR